MALAPGTKLGLYEIQSPLGAGGMGEVYRATDTKLGRDVALKVLPAEMAHDPERLARFRREAKSLAQLDHPNIVTIYSVEECDGVHFLTMQLVEGQPLDRMIPACGLPIEQIVEIAGALGDALAAAHEKGIVHRDLKPANVMVSNEGRVKVLDFGLAKDVRGANLGDATLTSASQTQVGVVMGTPAYMSPEQTSGRPLDHRTDIFSMGVLLHEMATGRRPFEGTSSAELVSAILRDTPPSVTDVRPDLPSDLARIIRRCLEKDPRHRVQTARDVSNEFRDLLRQTSQKSVPSKTSTTRAVAASDSGAARADEGFWVAVLPFKYTGASAELKALAEGLSDEIVTGMSRFSYLRVIARGSTAKYSSESGDVRAIGKELGARYVMEGNLRQAGTKLRLAVQLVDAVSGTHLWAENYERTFSPEDIFALQDDLVPRIVSTVADYYGILPHCISGALRRKADDQLSPYEAVLRAFSYFERIAPEEHAPVRQILERAVSSAPDQGEIWAMLSTMYWHEHAFGFNPQPDPLGRALAAARRSVDVAPTNNLGHSALAATLFFQKNILAFRPAAERAIELNRMDGSNLATMGILMAYSGDWEHGCSLVESALQLNPHHPGWYWFAHFFNAYRKGDYRGALSIALKFNMPGYFYTHALTAAVYGQLGLHEPAQKALQELLAIRPDFAVSARKEFEKLYDPELVEHLIDGLRKAGLEMGDEAGTPATMKKSDSGPSRAEEGFWVAVLPFKYKGSEPGLEALADGLTADIVTGLSRFSYLRVIARSSSGKYSSESGDVRAIGKQLGARYVMEGSIRQAGSTIRLAVQLVDAITGAHLWAETFERAFRPEEIFVLQDQLVPRIVSTVADTHGVLPYSMNQTVRNKNPDELTPYEALLRGFAYFKHVNPADHAGARAALEKAVEQAPGNADCWAMLSMLYREENNHGFNVRPDPVGRALAAARRAVDTAPSNHLAHHALASILFFRRETQAFRSAAQRAIELNPMDGFTIGYMGFLLSYSGEWDRGCALMEQARNLNPNHPGWYWFPPFFNAYRKGDYRAALEFALKVNMPGFWRNELALAATYGKLGELELARNAARELLAARPDFAGVAWQECQKWWDPDLVGQIIDGLRQAGLQIADEKEDAASAPAASDIRPASGAARAEEGFWVAVLPFRYSGNNADLKALADGLSEEIVTGLSRFSYLRVIARGSTAKYSSEAGDIRAIGKELGARYVMEGSLRQAGSKLRLAVQLVDAVSGAHLWAENYERSFSPENIFGLQDDLVPRIVSTVADQHGVLPHSISNLIRHKSDEQLSPYEAVLRVFSLHERMSQEEHASVRALLERAVKNAPGEGDCWAMLATIYCDEYMFGFPGQPDPLGRSQAAARRAIEIEPSNWLASQALAQSLFFRREWQAFRPVAERTIALNRMDGAACAFMGILLALSGEWERGCEVAAAAMQLNPHHPGWYWLATVFNAYRKQDYRASVAATLRINMPGYFWGPATSAAAFGQLGEREPAEKALNELLAIRPDFAATARQEFGKWFDDELAEHYVDGLSKAGLEVGGNAGTSVAAKRSDSGAVRADEGFWVAVLPFRYSGNNADLKALADGLSEEIVTGLSRFSYLRVIARGSTAKYSSEAGDIRAIGKELGARYVMEGSLRQAGSKLRLAVQLVDAVSGAHLWAENYERSFSPENIFGLQDDLVPRIVSTVADQHGVLPRGISEELRGKNEEDLTPHEAVLRSFSFIQRISPTEHATARRILERAVGQDPNQADAWAMLAIMYDTEFADEYNPRPNPLERAMAAAQRAVDLAPTHALGYYALAFTYFFRKDNAGFRAAVEQAVALNPMDGSVMGLLGLLVHHLGEIDRGTHMVEAAMQLNPHYPPVFRAPAFLNAYAEGKYAEALELAVRFNMPGFFHALALRAAALGQLGQREAGQQAVQELLALRPDFATSVRRDYGKWWNSKTVEHLIDGLRKAGLEIEGTAGNAVAAKGSDSGAVRADEGFWVAVLPFKYSGNNADLAALADGLSEDVVTGLSRFSYLRVIARGSTAKYSSESGDVRAIGKELGARYVMEGSLRQAGTKLRLAVQLVDAVSGAHLWAENYERNFGPEAVFELQDDLVPRIVSTVADSNGVLPHSMSESVRGRSPQQLSPYEAVLRSFSYFERATPEELAAARSGLELAVRKAPAYADAWAMLAFLCVQDYAQGFNLQADSLTSGSTAAQRAVEAAPSNPLAYGSLAVALFFQKEFQSFRNAAERTVALNPMDGNSIAFLGELLTYAGDWERGLALADRAKQLNPNHPGWYWYADFYNAYRQGDDRGALNFARKVNLPGHWFAHASVAAACGQLGQREAADKAVRDLLKLRPDFVSTVRKDIEKWWNPEYVVRLIDGWRRAGLEIASEQSSAVATSPAETAGKAGSITPSIAVLPFANMSADKDQEYFSDGLAEEIINLLAHIPGLKVIARTSAFAFRGKEQDIRGIADALGVTHVLQGSVRRAGERIRVTAQLIHAGDGAHLWSERFDRDLTDVFAIQDEIGQAISEALKVRLAPRTQTVNLDAYQNYLRGRYHVLRLTPESLEKGKEYLEQALAADSNYAPAYSALAEYFHCLWILGIKPIGEIAPLVKSAAEKALAIDPLNSEAHSLLAAMAASFDYHWKMAETHHHKAMAEPVPPLARFRYVAWYLLPLGRVADAMEQSRLALETDPLNMVFHYGMALSRNHAKRYHETIECARRALEIDSNSYLIWFTLGHAQLFAGLAQEAILSLQRVVDLVPWWPMGAGLLAAAYYKSGELEHSQEWARKLTDLNNNAYGDAIFRAATGEVDAMFAALNAAHRQRDVFLLHIQSLPFFDPYRADPRFQALLLKMNLA